MSVKESYAGKINRKLNKKLHVIDVAAGRAPADLVLKNATYVNVFSNELCHGDIAVAEGLIVGMGEYHGKVEVDVSGKLVLPGFIDAHIHLESSLVSPTEFAKAVLPHGTTTVITDPHEIANVMGTDGIEYMLQATEDLPVDVRFMLPSCVPATPLDESGANLDYRAIDSFYDHPRVQGLAEMMNYRGRDQRRRSGGGEDRGLSGPPQEDRRPCAGPFRQGSQRLHRRRRLLRPRVLRSWRTP